MVLRSGENFSQGSSYKSDTGEHSDNKYNDSYSGCAQTLNFIRTGVQTYKRVGYIQMYCVSTEWVPEVEYG